MEAKKSFVEASTSSSKNKLEQEMDPSMLTTFLETCMNFLHLADRDFQIKDLSSDKNHL